MIAEAFTALLPTRQAIVPATWKKQRRCLLNASQLFDYSTAHVAATCGLRTSVSSSIGPVNWPMLCPRVAKISDAVTLSLDGNEAHRRSAV